MRLWSGHVQIVLDTNILVSSLISKGTPPYELQQAWLAVNCLIDTNILLFFLGVRFYPLQILIKKLEHAGLVFGAHETMGGSENHDHLHRDLGFLQGLGE